MRYLLLGFLLLIRSSRWKMLPPPNWLQLWQRYEEEYHVFLNPFDLNTFLSANLSVGKKVGFNYEWAIHLILEKDENINRTFLATLGHELTHLDGDWKPPLRDKNINNRFVNWTNEVHADIGSSLKFPELTRSDIVYSSNYKRSVKLNTGLNDTETDTHPSWARRIRYVENYNFNKDLILKIADDAQCTDKMLINSAINFFPDIILN